jgi:hypothetical protein
VVIEVPKAPHHVTMLVNDGRDVRWAQTVLPLSDDALTEKALGPGRFLLELVRRAGLSRSISSWLNSVVSKPSVASIQCLELAMAPVSRALISTAPGPVWVRLAINARAQVLPDFGYEANQ